MFFEKDKNGLAIKEYNPLVLAFVGDSVHTLFVREKMSKEHTSSAGRMHSMSAKFCNAKSQSKMLDVIIDELLDDERDIVLRARNAKNTHVAKGSSPLDYKKATSFEALIGYLYLTKKDDRMLYIMNKTIDVINQI